MYKYNIIEQFIRDKFLTHDLLQFRYLTHRNLVFSVPALISNYQEYQTKVSFKIFLYIMIECNIFIKI